MSFCCVWQDFAALIVFLSFSFAFTVCTAMYCHFGEIKLSIYIQSSQALDVRVLVSMLSHPLKFWMSSFKLFQNLCLHHPNVFSNSTNSKALCKRWVMLFTDKQVVLQVPLRVAEANNAFTIGAVAFTFIIAALMVLVIADMAALKTSGTIFRNNLRSVLKNWRCIRHDNDELVHWLQRRDAMHLFELLQIFT